jgi:hypothetical protein
MAMKRLRPPASRIMVRPAWSAMPLSNRSRTPNLVQEILKSYLFTDRRENLVLERHWGVAKR